MQKTNQKKISAAKSCSQPPRKASEKNTAEQIRREVKRRGEIGEAAFLKKAASMGFGVSKPWGDSDRYDLVVDVGGRMLRVQVKSAHCVSASPGGGYNIRACPHNHVSYRDDEIDILVAYIVPEDVWYVFPASAFSTMKSLRLWPHPGKKTSKFEQYREAWHAFHEVK
jgi:hypothetical protein